MKIGGVGKILQEFLERNEYLLNAIIILNVTTLYLCPNDIKKQLNDMMTLVVLRSIRSQVVIDKKRAMNGML